MYIIYNTSRAKHLPKAPYSCWPNSYEQSSGGEEGQIKSRSCEAHWCKGCGPCRLVCGLRCGAGKTAGWLRVHHMSIPALSPHTSPVGQPIPKTMGTVDHPSELHKEIVRRETEGS